VLRVPGNALRYVPGGMATPGERSAETGRGPSGSAHVWVLHDGRPMRVPITIGLDDDTYAEVIEGELKPGDQVVTAEQVPTDTAAARAPFFRL
jgi:HlyD family secretion protein